MQKCAAKALLKTRCILYAISPRFSLDFGPFGDRFGTLLGPLGASWAPFGRLLGSLGRLLGSLGAILDALGAILGRLRRLLGRLGWLLGRSGDDLGRSQGLLDDPGSVFKPLRVDFGPPGSRFGTPQRSVECRRSQ